MSESVVTEIFFVATEGLADTTDVDVALTAQGLPPLEARGTGSAQVSVDAGSVGTDAPSNNASSPVSSASPLQ